MKRTLRSTNAKRVISTAGEKNVKDSGKNKGPLTAPVNFREPVEKQFVIPKTEDVEKVIEEVGSCLDTNNYVMLHQIKSDLNVLLKMLQQNEAQCINDNIILDSPQKTVGILTAVPHNSIKKDTNQFQQTTISRNKSINQNKIINNPVISSQSIKAKASAGMYKQNIKPNNLERRKAARKSRLEIYPCFNISIDSTSESETRIVSESKKVQKLTSFWNDRTKNYPQINLDVPTSPDKIMDGLEYAFELRKKLNEEVLSRSSLCSLQSRPWQRTMPVDVYESLCSSPYQKLAPTLGISDINHASILKSENKTTKDMSTNTESMESMISHTEMKVTNFTKDDGHIKIIINLIGDFGKEISNSVNLDDKIERNNEIKDIEMKLKQSSDKSLNNQNDKDPVVIDCNLGPMKKEINMSKNYSVNPLCIQKEDETDKVSYVSCQESSGNFEIVSEGKEVSILSVAEENVSDVETRAYFGGGDSSFDQLYSQSSSLKVNFSMCSDDKVEQSYCNVYSNTGFENELNQLNILEDKTKYFEVSENTSMNNIMENISGGTITQDLKSLTVKTMNIDKTMGSKNGNLTLRDNFNGDLIHVQINEKTANFNDDVHQEYSNKIIQTNLSEKSILYDQVDKKSGDLDILEKKLIQDDCHCLQTFSNETNQHVETDYSVIPTIEKIIDEFKTRKENITFCQKIIGLNKSAFNNSLMNSFLEHVIKDLCNSNNFDYIWQKYQKGGFQHISERDILYLALCHPVVRKRNVLMEETTPFTVMKRKCMDCKNNTTPNSLQKCRNIIEFINVGQIISNNCAEVVMSGYYCSFRRLTTKKVVSIIYHCALSLSMFYIIEKELLGFFSNSKLVYPF